MSTAEALSMDAPVTLVGVGVARTDVGRRREHNEDQVLVCPDLGLFAVADGMGGHDAGDVASAIVAASMQEYFWADAPLLGGPDKDELPRGARRLVQSVHYANHEVYATSGRSAQQGGMGSTVVAVHVAVDEQQIHICHVGDSRCYRFREGHFEQLTEDHSMINEALRLNPNLSPEILKQLPTNVVTRALGTKELVKPDIRTEELRAGDIYLLCSDGLNGEVSDDDLAFMVADGDDLEETCELLIGMANDAGGRDNVSVLLLRITEQSVSEDMETGPTQTAPAVWSEDTADAQAPTEYPPDDDVEVDVDVEIDVDVEDTVPEGELARAAQAARTAHASSNRPDDEVRRRRAERARRIASATARLDAALDELAAIDEWDTDGDPPPPERSSGGGRLLIVPESDPAPDSDPGAPIRNAEPVPLPLARAVSSPPPPPSDPEVELDGDRPSMPLPLSPAALQPEAQSPPPRSPSPLDPLRASLSPEDFGPVISGQPIMEVGNVAEPESPAPAAPSDGSHRCIACGHKLGPRERFCGMCGRSCDSDGVEVCKRCNQPLLEETRYCVWCGIRHGRDWE